MSTFLFILLCIMMFVAAVLCGALLSAGGTTAYILYKRHVPKAYHYSAPDDLYHFQMDSSIYDENTKGIDGTSALDDFVR